MHRVPRGHVEGVHQRALLGDVAARRGVRDVHAPRVLMKKAAETARGEASHTTSHGMPKALGMPAIKDAVTDRISHAEEAHLIFEVHSAAAKFVERRGSPECHSSDDGPLNLLLRDEDAAPLENEGAVALHDTHGEGLFHLKSPRAGVDVDLYVPDEGLAVQAARSIRGARQREVGGLTRLAALQRDVRRPVVVTKRGQGEIDEGGVRVEVVPAWRFPLQLAGSRGA